MKGVATYNNAVDLYNEQVDRTIREIKAFKTWKNRDSNPAFNSLQNAGSPLMQPSADPFSAFMAPSPRDFLNKEPKEPDHFTRLKSSVELLESAGKRAEKLFDTAHDLYSDMVRFVFDYPYAGFTFANDYVCYYEGVELPVTPIDVPDPYEASMGLLMLCSPPALRSLYDGIPGAAVEADLQLPWLTGIITGVARDIASHLPWGVNVSEEDERELGYKNGWNPGFSFSVCYGAAALVLYRDYGCSSSETEAFIDRLEELRYAEISAADILERAKREADVDVNELGRAET